MDPDLLYINDNANHFFRLKIDGDKRAKENGLTGSAKPDRAKQNKMMK